MAKSQTPAQKDLSEVAELVVEALRKQPEVQQADQMSSFTNRSADNKKIYLHLGTGEIVRFSITSFIRRKTEPGE